VTAPSCMGLFYRLIIPASSRGRENAAALVLSPQQKGTAPGRKHEDHGMWQQSDGPAEWGRLVQVIGWNDRLLIRERIPVGFRIIGLVNVEQEGRGRWAGNPTQ
jgi:hypothetical protein